MSFGNRKATEEAVTLFQAVGRASLVYDIQDSHSGNMAVKIKEADGRGVMAVTATGSQKGDLEPDQVCFFPFSETDYRAFYDDVMQGVFFNFFSFLLLPSL